MHLQLVPAGRGAQWVRLGLTVVRRQPLAMIGLFLFLFMGSALLAELSLAGQAFAMALMPGITVGFMLAAQKVQQGLPPSPPLLLKPLMRSSTGHRLLWVQGALYAGLALLVLLAIDAWQGDAPQASVEAPEPSSSAASQAELQPPWVDDPSIRTALLMRAVLVLLLSVPFWHAGALAHWHGVPLARSLFFSTVACLRNGGAFLLYGLSWAGLTMALTLVLSLLVLVGLPAGLVWPAAMAGVMGLSTAFFASLYFTFIDCFGDPDGGERDSKATPSTPVDA